MSNVIIESPLLHRLATHCWRLGWLANIDASYASFSGAF